jgi:hypothetical protein
VGASVKLTIAVKSTQQAVLVVPVTALSVGADGSSRLQVERPGGRMEYVTVEPGLAAQGLVEVRPIDGELKLGDLVVVGDRGGASDGSGTGGTGATGGGTTGGGATEPSGASGDTSSSGGTGATGETGSSGTSGDTTPKGGGGDGTTSPRAGPTGTTP